MARLIVTDGFMDDLADAPAFVEAMAWEKLSLVESHPGIGSSMLSSTLRRRFGTGLLKLLVDPYEIVYRWNEKTDDVEVLALVHQRSLRGAIG